MLTLFCLTATMLCGCDGVVFRAPWESVHAFDAAFPMAATHAPRDQAVGHQPALVYFTIAGDHHYEEMFRLLLITLRPVLFNMADALHVLVLTREENLQVVLQILEETVPNPRLHNVSVQVMDALDTFDVAVNKLAIHRLPSFPLIDHNGKSIYSRLLYMDVDMLALIPDVTQLNPTGKIDILWPLERLLRSEADGGVRIKPGTIYAPGEPNYDVDHEYFSLRGARGYTAAQLEEFRLPEALQTPEVHSTRRRVPSSEHRRPGFGADDTALLAASSSRIRARKRREPFNTGFLLFQPSTATTLRHLDAALNAALSTPKAERPEFCMEQPYLNNQMHTAWYEGKVSDPTFEPVDWRTLEDWVVIDRKNTAYDDVPLPDDAAVVHITGLNLFPERGPRAKLTRMRALFMKFLACGAELRHLGHCPPREELLM